MPDVYEYVVTQEREVTVRSEDLRGAIEAAEIKFNVGQIGDNPEVREISITARKVRS